jgi:hypothetical protein
MVGGVVPARSATIFAVSPSSFRWLAMFCPMVRKDRLTGRGVVDMNRF